MEITVQLSIYSPKTFWIALSSLLKEEKKGPLDAKSLDIEIEAD